MAARFILQLDDIIMAGVALDAGEGFADVTLIALKRLTE